jgi:anti-sigma factor RsiW
VQRSISTTGSVDAALSCHELVELVTEYLDGVLPAATRARFEAHVARCGGCERYVEQLRETVHLVGQLRREHVPRSLLEAFRGWRAH